MNEIKCPICGCVCVELSRESCIHESGKLADRVYLRCPNHVPVLVRYDHSIRDYSKEDKARGYGWRYMGSEG